MYMYIHITILGSYNFYLLPLTSIFHYYWNNIL